MRSRMIPTAVSVSEIGALLVAGADSESDTLFCWRVRLFGTVGDDCADTPLRTVLIGLVSQYLNASHIAETLWHASEFMKIIPLYTMQRATVVPDPD